MSGWFRSLAIPQKGMGQAFSYNRKFTSNPANANCGAQIYKVLLTWMVPSNCDVRFIH